MHVILYNCGIACICHATATPGDKRTTDFGNDIIAF